MNNCIWTTMPKYFVLEKCAKVGESYISLVWSVAISYSNLWPSDVAICCLRSLRHSFLPSSLTRGPIVLFVFWNPRPIFYLPASSQPQFIVFPFPHSSWSRYGDSRVASPLRLILFDLFRVSICLRLCSIRSISYIRWILTVIPLLFLLI